MKQIITISDWEGLAYSFFYMRKLIRAIGRYLLGHEFTNYVEIVLCTIPTFWINSSSPVAPLIRLTTYTLDVYG